MALEIAAGGEGHARPVGTQLGGVGELFVDNALFEIGSLTKVFTAVAFQRLVAHGDMALNDTVGSILRPYNLTFRNHSVGTIQMRELLSHTSGVARLPGNLHGSACNHFTNYSRDDLFSYLSNITELSSRGTFLYSNFGFGLLGYLMQLYMGIEYEQLCKQLVFGPIGMRDTNVTLSRGAWRRQVAPGVHNGLPTERSTPYGVLQGQGAFHSTVSDMMRFLVACLSSMVENRPNLPTTLIDGLQQAAMPLAPDDFNPNEHGEVGSGWEMYFAADETVVWKSGGTLGYGSFMAFNPYTGRAAVAIENCGNCGDKAVDQLTRNLIDNSPDLHVLSLNRSALGVYEGCYQLGDMTDKNRQLAGAKCESGDCVV